MKRVEITYKSKSGQESQKINLLNCEHVFRTFNDLTFAEKEAYEAHYGYFLDKKSFFIVNHDLLHILFMQQAGLKKGYRFIDQNALAIQASAPDSDYVKAVNDCMTLLDAKATLFEDDNYIGSYVLLVYLDKIEKAKVDILVSWSDGSKDYKRLFSDVNQYFRLNKGEGSMIINICEQGLEDFLDKQGILKQAIYNFDISVECLINNNSIGPVSVRFY